MFLLFLGTMTSASAVVVQKIYLKNGSVLYGYIEKQDTKGNLTISTEKAEICLTDSRYATKQDSLLGTYFYKDVSINDKSIDEKNVDKSWKEWAEENDAFVMSSGNRTLILSDLMFTGKNVKNANNVRVLQKGTKIKYLELSPNSYDVNWKNIKKITGDKRKNTELSGINRIYQTRNGNSYEGEFAEQTSNTLGLYVNGLVQTFEQKDVVKYTFRAINENQGIFEQSPLIDIVRGKNGSELRGLIIEQNYMNSKNSENYILVQQENGGIQSMKMSELVEIRRIINDKYAPKYDVVLKTDEVLVNRKNVHAVPVTELDGNLIVDSVEHKTVIEHTQMPAQISVEYNISNSSNIEVYQIVPLTQKPLKKNKEKKYTFSYKDLASVSCRPESLERSKNATSKAVYSVKKSGLYALYDSRNNKAIVLEIK